MRVLVIAWIGKLFLNEHDLFFRLFLGYWVSPKNDLGSSVPENRHNTVNLVYSLNQKLSILCADQFHCPICKYACYENTCLWLRKKCVLKGLPWWRSGWESACQCRGHGFEPWSGKIPHAAGQLGPWATTTEPAHLEPVLRNKRGHDSERPAHRDEEWPPLATTRESPRTETKTQHSQK